MLEGIIRESTGKKATKALRKDGYLIANIYGQGLENINVAFKKLEFAKAIKAKETFYFNAKINGNDYKLVIQDYQKDPVSYDLLHVDLLVAQEGKSLKYQIPVRTKGTPIGLKNRGVLMQYRKRIIVKADIKDLPSFVEIDVSDLDVGNNILAKDLNLGDKINIVLGSTVPVVGVIKAK